MKIKNLLLLGLMAFGSMNAFAADFKAGGLVFNVDATAKTATVTGVRTGYITATQKSVEIPATVTDGDGVVCKVIGFNANWNTTAYTVTGYETTAAPGCESLTINIDNFTAVPTTELVIAGLKNLTLKGTSTIDADITIPDFTATLTTLETLDLDELAAKSGKKLSLTAQTAGAKLTTVTLPGIDLPTDAFKGQTALTTISGVKNIGGSAFDGAVKLATVTFTGTVIGNKAFNDCAALTTIDLSKVETIGKKAFYGTKITAANLAAATFIGEQAFESVTTLTAITLKSEGDANTVKVGDKAFNFCTGVEALTIPATVVYENGATAVDVFANMDKLATLTINNDVIPAAAFTNDNAIASLTIVNADLATIPAGAFTSTKITVIDLAKCPNVVAAPTAFAANAFTKIKLAGSSTPIANIDLSNAAASLKTVTLSAVETNVAINQFQNFTKLATVVLPATVTSIGNNAFDGTALTAITIPQGANVGASAFANCAALATVEFAYDADNAATSTIGNNAFEGTAITAIVLPASVTSLGADAFLDCAALKTFNAGASPLTTIPAAFSGCDKLKAAILPKTTVKIDNDAFNGLAKLATVTFKHEGADDAASAVMSSIGNRAFKDCVALTAIDLSLTQLASLDKTSVFDGCTALATITLPEEMNSLAGPNIFKGTIIETLDASMVDGTVATIFGTDSDNPNTTLKVLKLGNATINSDAFAYCTKLKTAILGAATIQNDAFAYCEKLATVTVSPYDEDTNTGASIWGSAFDHCSALTTFNYTSEWQDLSDWGWLSAKAFTYCTPYLTINTTKEFASMYGNAPLNATWTADALNCVVTTVQDKANANQFVAKFWDPANDVIFNAEDVKLYTVYVDGETAYYQACRPDGGYYYVYNGDHVILKTTEAKEVTYEVDNSMTGKTAVAFDDIQSLPFDGELGDIQTALGMSAGDYLYRLTNTAEIGFGFTAYTGTTIKANQFFISSTKKPESAARLNNVWLDEDGNVESDATAIQKIQNNTEDVDAIYNLSGQKVNASYKGVVIKNGKKYVK